MRPPAIPLAPVPVGMTGGVLLRAEFNGGWPTGVTP